MPLAIGLTIDYAVRTSDGSAMIIAAAGIFALFILLTTCWRTGAWFLAKGVQEEAHGFRLQAVRRMLTGSGIETERTSGEVLSITTSDATQSAEVLESGSWVVAALVGLAVSAFLLLRIDWALGLGVLVGVPVLVLLLNALGPLVERRTANQQQAVGLAAGVAADLLGGLRPLRGFRWRARGRTAVCARRVRPRCGPRSGRCGPRRRSWGRRRSPPGCCWPPWPGWPAGSPSRDGSPSVS